MKKRFSSRDAVFASLKKWEVTTSIAVHLAARSIRCPQEAMQHA
jgi:hypothetical protein